MTYSYALTLKVGDPVVYIDYTPDGGVLTIHGKVIGTDVPNDLLTFEWEDGTVSDIGYCDGLEDFRPDE